MPTSNPKKPAWWDVLDEEWMLALLAVALAALWTLVGILVAAIANQVRPFVREWILIQGTFAVMAASFLALLARSRMLERALEAVVGPVAPIPMDRRRPALIRGRRVVLLTIAVLGTLSTIHLGFRVEPPTRYFMWITCLIVCIAAGHVTWHFVEILISAANLALANLEVFIYSPGETQSLRRLATYYSVFSGATTIGYIFAFIGTVANDWTGPPTLVRSVQALWPVVYVPCCILVLVYPHLAIRRVIRTAKDRLISGYQRQINSILASRETLSSGDITQVNSLADLIDRIERTPNFALRLPIVVTTAGTALANFATLLVPQEALAEMIRGHLPWS